VDRSLPCRVEEQRFRVHRVAIHAGRREIEGSAGATAEGTGELVGAAFGGFKANRAERRVPSATPASRRSCIPGCLPADSPMPCKSPPGWRTGSL
jgi:hypothetical protein